MLEGLTAVLTTDPRVEITGTATTLAEFRRGLGDWKPTVVVADYQLPDGLGTEVPAHLDSVGIDAPVVLMSGIESARLLDEAIAAGCSGYVSKALRSSSLLEAIVDVGRGASVFPPDALREAGRADLTQPGATLTPRELEVLQLLAMALNAGEISDRLELSLNTTRNHIRAILAKMHARSQLDAVVTALRLGLVALDPPGA